MKNKLIAPPNPAEQAGVTKTPLHWPTHYRRFDLSLRRNMCRVKLQIASGFRAGIDAPLLPVERHALAGRDGDARGREAVRNGEREIRNRR